MTQMGKAMLAAAVAAALGIGLGTGFGGSATAAEATSSHINAVGHAGPPTATDLSAQRRVHRRAPTRIRVYPRYQRLSPNAVRECSATYVQEFRPSGTVIVPRMHCFWRQG
ncbi:MAG: hypothetical protein ACTHNN_13890 [Xanthobacteraceae bacterium]